MTTDKPQMERIQNSFNEIKNALLRMETSRHSVGFAFEGILNNLKSQSKVLAGELKNLNEGTVRLSSNLKVLNEATMHLSQTTDQILKLLTAAEETCDSIKTMESDQLDCERGIKDIQTSLEGIILSLESDTMEESHTDIITSNKSKKDSDTTEESHTDIITSKKSEEDSSSESDGNEYIKNLEQAFDMTGVGDNNPISPEDNMKNKSNTTLMKEPLIPSPDELKTIVDPCDLLMNSMNALMLKSKKRDKKNKDDTKKEKKEKKNRN